MAGSHVSFCLSGGLTQTTHDAIRIALKQEVSTYRAAAYSANTKTYRSQMKSYVHFCEQLKVPLCPIDPETLTLYAAYLAQQLTPSSVPTVFECSMAVTLRVQLR